MATIEQGFLISTEPGTESASVCEIAMPVSAVSSPKGASCTSFPPQGDVGNVPQGMTDEQRRQAIERASALVGYFDAECQLFWTLWGRDSDFTHKAAYDLALSNYSKAIEIRDSLMLRRKA